MPKRIIKTDVTDWDDDFETKEPDVMTDEQVIERRKEGMHSAEAGRHMFIALQRGLADEGIVSDSKDLIQLGLVMETNRKTARMKDVELPNGKNISVREFVSPVSADKDKEIKDVAISESSSEKGMQNAIDYLLQVVPGYIHNRLAIIASNDGDTQKYADELKDKVDEIMVELG